MAVPAVENIYVLSPMQQGLLFHSLYAPEEGLYVDQVVMELPGEVDAGLLERAWRLGVDRHPVLRTSFHWQGLDKPLQVVHPAVQVPLAVEDWRVAGPGGSAESRLQDFLAADLRRGLDLSKPPLLRLTLVRLSEAKSLLLWTYHHILLDGWSGAILTREFLESYRALAAGRDPGLPPARPFGEYVSWLRRQDPAAAEAFWRGRLAGFRHPTPLALPWSAREPQAGDGPAEQEDRTVTLPAASTAALRAFARRHQLTLNSVVQGAWALLLHTYSGEDDVVFGATVAGRPAEIPGIESMVGLFINTLPVRARFASAACNDGLVPWLRSLQAWQTEMQPFEHSPLAEVQTWSEVPAGRPLFESILVFENVPGGATIGEGGDGGRGEGLGRYLSRNNYPLTLVALPGETLAIRALYDRRRFAGDGAARMLEHLVTLLEGMAAAAPGTRVEELSPLTAAERRRVVEELNATGSPFPAEATVQDLFAAVAGARPDAVAIEEDDLRLTYAELSRRAGRLARQLEKLGVEPEVPIGLCVERSANLVVGMLGILEAGGAYVPLDPSYPEERLSFLLEDAAVPVLVTRERELARLPAAALRTRMGAVKTVLLDHPQPEQDAHPPPRHIPGNPGDPGGPAYVMYTSGSTGKPKGVEVTHRGIARLVRSAGGLVRFGPGEVWSHLAPPSFDASTLEVWGALLHGARLAVLPRALSLAGLAAAVQRHGVTTLFLTVGLFHQVVEAGADELRGISQLLTGGDVVSPVLARRALEELPGIAVVNCYGPTESTTYIAVHRVTSPDAVAAPLPIGGPAPNCRVFLVDRALRPVPEGVAGELLTAGCGLARGYLRRPDLTAERFIPDPFDLAGGGRLYRTGDLARWRPDGTLEFLGRVDQQVKIRGFRVEPGEVEAVLAGHPAVARVVVIARADLPGGKGLVAHVVPREAPLRTADLREWLAARLPEFMVPSVFAEEDELPLDPHEKVDRRALARRPLSGAAGTPAGATAPRGPLDPVQELLASLWADVLRVERVGADGDFLALGGHSLLAMQLLSRVREAFKVDLPLAAVFEAPTLAGQAARIGAALRQAEGTAPQPLLVPVARAEPLPLSFAQQRLWILDRFDPGLPAYNIPLPLRLDGPLSAGALDRAIGAVVARHEALRTRFAVLEAMGEPVQVIDPPDEWSRRGGLARVDLTGLPRQLPSDEIAAEVERLVSAEAERRFDLAAGPLLRGTLLTLGPEEHALLLTVHHIVADGWSMGILYRELAAFYDGAALSPALPALPVQYADYAAWQRRWLAGEVLDRQLAWWRQRLAGLPAGLELPGDRPRPALRSYRGARVPFELGPELSAAVRGLAAGERATLFMTLLATLQELLGRLSGQEDLAVGTPVANRTRLETEGLIGFFANTLVLRGDLAGDPTVRQLLARVREATVAASMHQDVPFEKLVEELRPERSLALTPFFQVLFSLDRPEVPAGLTGLAPQPLAPRLGSAKFDLSFTMAESTGGIAGTVEYGTDLFDEATAVRLAGQLLTLLAGFAAHPGRPAGALPLLSEAESHQLLVEGNQEAAAEADETLHGLFARQAERTPERLALRWDGGEMTYRELRRRSAELAQRLRRLGVAPEVPAGIFLDRRPEMIVGLLAVLEAGGAYVPLDPAYPRERVALTLEDCRAPVVLTRSELAERLPAGPERVLLDELEGEEIGRIGPIEQAGTSHNLAYLIYTSGSTGRPKGVALEHRSAVALLRWAGGVFGDEDLAGVLASTSICFDLSVFEIFLPLSRGGTIVLAGSALDLLKMGEDGAPVTLVNTVPSAAAELLRGRSLPAGVRVLNLAGEPIPPGLVERIAAEPGLERAFNLYGPSEATTYSTFEKLERPRAGEGRAPAIGRPVAGTSAHVLDRRLRPVPVGVPGELFLGGAGLARGYLGRPEMTAAGFVPDPFSNLPGSRLYRTGDLVRILPDGRLDFLVRIDHQVKVRGFRIELGEVEAALARHPRVAAAAAVVREGASRAPEERRLVAYVVPRDGGEPLAAAELRASLLRALPEFMVPSDFVLLDALPLGPTGKVDRKALPAPEALRLGPETPFAEPRTDLERAVATVMREVLGVERVGLEDNFFELGGHSLRMVRAAAVLEERLGRPVPVLDLFRFPTIAALSLYWSEGERAVPRQVPPESLEQRAEERREVRSRRRDLRLSRTAREAGGR